LPPALRARALRGAGVLAWAQRENQEAAALMEQSLALFRELGDAEGTATILRNLGTILGSQGAYEQARAVQEESLTLHRELGDTRGISSSLGNLGETSYFLGDYSAAMRYWEENLPLERELQDLHRLAITLNNLGIVGRELGELDRAQDWSEEAVGLFRELDARSTLAQALQSLADLRLKRQEYAQATVLLHESMMLARELGDPQTVAFCLESFATLAAAQGWPERASRIFGAAEGLRATAGAALSPAERSSLQPSLDAARSALAEEAWCTAWAEGQAMTLERAIEYALSALEPSPVLPAVSPDASGGEQAAGLTRREREIAGLIAQGLTNRQIAHRLVLSGRTVDAHAVNIMRKLGLRTRAQVAAWAAQQGLLTER
ncbi:MAG TPA: tetratricopeptide repeat protein, partial [Herpetosiphonaceae bacterium]|nr:tetratricopeptide repeat protein [Herpetosiphonaceae bacterium]